MAEVGGEAAGVADVGGIDSSYESLSSCTSKARGFLSSKADNAKVTLVKRCRFLIELIKPSQLFRNLRF